MIAITAQGIHHDCPDNALIGRSDLKKPALNDIRTAARTVLCNDKAVTTSRWDSCPDDTRQLKILRHISGQYFTVQIARNTFGIYLS